MAKMIASEYATAGADYGIQILGGYGYAQEYNMQRYWPRPPAFTESAL